MEQVQLLVVAVEGVIGQDVLIGHPGNSSSDSVESEPPLRGSVSFLSGAGCLSESLTVSLCVSPCFPPSISARAQLVLAAVH